MTLVLELLERLDLIGAERLHEVLITPSYPTSRHVVSLLMSERSGPVLVVKTPRLRGDDHGVRHEAALLERLDGLLPPSLAVPHVVATPTYDATTLLVETAVPGAPLGPERVRRDVDAAVAAGVLAATGLPETGRLDGPGWDLLLRPVRTICAQLPDGAALLSGTERAARRLLHRALPAVVEHGDMSHPNVLLPGPGRVGLVDWERGSWQGVPGHDLTQFLTYVARARTGAATVAGSVAAFEQAFLVEGAWALPVLQQHLAQRGIDAEAVPDLLVLCWARTAGTYVERLELDGDGAGTPLPAEEPDVALWRRCLAAAQEAG